MVVIDDYSRFPLVETMTSITAAAIIKRLDTIFLVFLEFPIMFELTMVQHFEAKNSQILRNTWNLYT